MRVLSNNKGKAPVIAIIALSIAAICLGVVIAIVYDGVSKKSKSRPMIRSGNTEIYNDIEKPVIYLYPEYDYFKATVRIDYAGELKNVYPSFDVDNKWACTCFTDGTILVDKKHYNSLFWEGEGGFEPDFTYSYCVKGENTAIFLDEKLHQLGLKDTECADFITYWMPRMVDNPYNIISFQEENYEDAARLHIYPNPDTVIRVFMAFKASDKELPITNIPDFPSTPERKGFTIVEWGGMEVTD